MNDTIKLKREKGTTRELVSFLGVCSVIAAVDEDEGKREAARKRVLEVAEGRYAVPTGTDDALRKGQKLAEVVVVRTLERGVEGGGMLRHEGVGYWGAN